MRGWRGAIAAALCLSLTGACGARSAAYDPAPWLEEYAALKKGLETSYANLAWFGSPQGGVDLPDLDRRTRAAIVAARDDRQAAGALKAFLSRIPDAHLDAYDAETANRLSALDEPQHRAGKPGDDSCAGYPRAEAIDLGFSLPFGKAPGVEIAPRGRIPFATGLWQGADGLKIGLVRIPSFELHQFPELCRGALSERRRDPGSGDMDFDDFVQAGYVLFLVEALQALQAQGAQALVVDVGGNPGGGDLAQYAAALLASEPLASNRIWMVAGEPARRLFAHQAADLEDALARSRDDARAQKDLQAALAQVRGRIAAIPQRACDMSWVWREQRTWAPAGCSNLVQAGYLAGPAQRVDWRAYKDIHAAFALYEPAFVRKYQGSWSGPVYVVIDRGTASAAEMFGAVLQDNHAAKLVGGRTIGAGCGNQGPYRFLKMPVTDQRIRVSDCVLLRADGSDEVAGLTPDIPISGGDARERARQTLAAIAEDLRRRLPARQDATPPPR